MGSRARPTSPRGGSFLQWVWPRWSSPRGARKGAREAPEPEEAEEEEDSFEEFYTFDQHMSKAAAPRKDPCANPCALVLSEPTRPRALTPVSEVLVRENLHRDRAVGAAIAREHRRLGEHGRLYTVIFKAPKLGFSLVLARLPESPRSRLVVDSTQSDGACYHLVRPLDELVAINNEKLIPLEMEAFPTLVYRLQHTARPMRLTFALGWGRDAAFREQARRRSVHPGQPASLPDSPGHQPRAEGFHYSPERVAPKAFATAEVQTSQHHLGVDAATTGLDGLGIDAATDQLMIDLRRPREAPSKVAGDPQAPRVVVDDDAFDCGCMAGDLSPFGLEPCSCEVDGERLLGDGLCQWDIDRAGDGEVLTAPEAV